MAEREEAAVRKGVAGAMLVAGAERDEKQQTLTSPKHVTAQSPSHFHHVSAAMATTSTTDTGRRKGRMHSESDESQGGSSWLDSNPPAT